ncbi:MAG: FKBP-type peptidyl-prolyl cis-trans isomerase [Pseudomonadota bacterium]
MPTAKVEKNSQITIHFSLSLADGTVVDGTEDGQPINFKIGDGTMIEAFEETIIGLSIGDKHQLSLEPRETFGFADEANHHWIEKEKFNHLDNDQQAFEKGLLIEFDTPDGSKMAGQVLEIQEDKVLMDFNHPLCGHEVIFSVEVLAIESL